MTSAGTSIIPEMVEKIEMLGLEGQFTVNAREIINNTTGNTIYFRGLKTGSGNQTAALKSLNNIATFVLDEAEEMPDESLFNKIDLSVRSQTAKNRIIMVLNPATKAHWIFNRFFERRGLQGGNNDTIDDTTYIHTTYQDNIENLPKSFLASMDRMKEDNADTYNHVVLGGWRQVAEGVIFTNWETGEFNKYGDYHGYGVDYGFSNDENTITEASINVRAKTIHLKEHLYETGLTTSQLAKVMLKTSRNGLFVADSAEPRLNYELKHTYKINIKDTIKGQGSVNLGIALLQDFKLIVDPNSTNLIKELNNYAWKEDKEVPEDKFNHCIDGVRYIVSYFLSNPHAGKYFIG